MMFTMVLGLLSPYDNFYENKDCPMRGPKRKRPKATRPPCIGDAGTNCIKLRFGIPYDDRMPPIQLPPGTPLRSAPLHVRVQKCHVVFDFLGPHVEVFSLVNE